ncbi:MAG: NF038104 family lipoprotein [Pseudohongiella sp.]|nr:NF038104 family lipoprotein [Pseudohongiella sp.]
MKTAWVRYFFLGALLISLTACLGTVVGTAVDVTLEVAKVPFKVAGAAIDVVTDDDDEEEKD